MEMMTDLVHYVNSPVVGERKLSLSAGLYVHVPFCVRKCGYCAFYSVPSLALRTRWLGALDREIARRAQPNLACDSVFLGGGTPSLLEPGEVAGILHALRRSFRLLEGAEVTLEANPGTVDLGKLAGFLSAGVNRLSIGAQSFDDEDLEFLGRIHRSDDVRRGFEAARAAGFENVGLDLIYGLPVRDRDHWNCQMEQAAALGPEHLSCYALSFEEGTALGKLLAEGRIAPPEEEEARDLFLHTRRRLEELGYAFYEVSNFARSSGLRCRHNLKYWFGAPYLGFGPAAHSFQPPVRSWNAPDVEAYVSALEAAGDPPGGSEILTSAQRALECLFLGLRTVEGADLDAIEALVPGFGARNEGSIRRIEREGLGRRSGARLALSPDGLAIADSLPHLFDLSSGS